MIRLGLFAAGVHLAEWLPAPLAYALARVVGLLLSALPTSPQHRLRRNLGVVLGVAPSSPALRPYVRRAYRTQTANYVDLLRARRITAQEVMRHTVREGEGWAAFDRATASRQGFLLVTAHFGRFEMMTHFVSHLGVRLTLPVERLQPPALFDLLCRLRQRPGLTLVAADLGLRPCLRALQRGDAVALFADWDSTGHGVPVRFFDAPARLPAGPGLLAVRTGVPIFVCFALPEDPGDPGDAGGAGGRVRAVVEPPLSVQPSGDFDADVRRATQLIAACLERYLRRYPEQWVMFHEIWPVLPAPGPGDARADAPPHALADAPADTPNDGTPVAGRASGVS